ncbi:DnaJ domain-containing protein [Herbiconiux sp. KACC 21604]|uniref:J domain-containing protein n=1 Tax=unclassified Herbiconiux TaxID=2618217 RepID=UPI001490F5FD|nr:DnaJ domain-containing protein [Herbiconiux sp. SALV-R1]QJU53210.1 DnaJ domain-containing protein [Herbiconiux sp. SALV-R1]WPO88160.1 DnaJ domain-containing protein [Herbiconiux sp. KACC 21604]
MSDSPASPTPYEVLGVDPGVSDGELRKAYRRLLRETHPDTGGDAARFDRVQRAWERVGTPADRAAYDRGHGSRSVGGDGGAAHSAGASGSASTSGSGFGPATGSFRAAGRAESSTVRARSYGHPGGQERERYLELLREWVGRGVTIDDPYEPALVRSAPREIRSWLAKALAEEATAGLVSTLGIGYTIWNNVLTGREQGGVPETIDHVVLGPAGLFAVQSEDWGGEVRLRKDELVGEVLGRGVEPLHELSRAAKTLARSLGVKFTALVTVVPDAALDEPAAAVTRGRLAGSVVVRRSLLPQLLRDGAGAGAGGRGGVDRTSIDRAFELRPHLQRAIRLA